MNVLYAFPAEMSTTPTNPMVGKGWMPTSGKTGSSLPGKGWMPTLAPGGTAATGGSGMKGLAGSLKKRGMINLLSQFDIYPNNAHKNIQ